jgi:hypothetical protein
MDLIFHCRVCSGPLAASAADAGAVFDCPHCGAAQAIASHAEFGAPASAIYTEAFLLGETDGDGLVTTSLPLKRARLHRGDDGQPVRTSESDSRATSWRQSLSQLMASAEEAWALLEQQNQQLREQLADRDRLLAEWQTCYESVEREHSKSRERKAQLQLQINAASNELAQARHELTRLKTEADGLRKANEALNRQLQIYLRQDQLRARETAREKSPGPQRHPIRNVKSGSSELAA